MPECQYGRRGIPWHPADTSILFFGIQQQFLDSKKIFLLLFSISRQNDSQCEPGFIKKGGAGNSGQAGYEKGGNSNGKKRRKYLQTERRQMGRAVY